MLVRSHVGGEERQTDDVGDGVDQLGAAGAAGPSAARLARARASHHAAAAPDALHTAQRRL